MPKGSMPDSLFFFPNDGSPNEADDKEIHRVNFDIDNPPQDSQEFLDFLKWYHGEERWKAKKLAGNNLPDVYDYSQITPDGRKIFWRGRS